MLHEINQPPELCLHDQNLNSYCVQNIILNLYSYVAIKKIFTKKLTFQLFFQPLFLRNLHQTKGCFANSGKAQKCQIGAKPTKAFSCDFYFKTFKTKFRSIHSWMFFNLGVLKNFAIFAGKHLYWNLFLIKQKCFSVNTTKL